MSGAWPGDDQGREILPSGVLKSDRGNGSECGLWIGLFAYQKYAHRQAIFFFFKKLGSLGKCSLFLITEAPKIKKYHKIRKVKQN